MLKVVILWFFIVMSSPILVYLFQDRFTIDGWMAIGLYEFDFYDGFYRSFYFYLMTLPTVLVVYIFRPGKGNFSYTGLNISFVVKPWVLIFLMGLYCVAFYFQLGMNGVETHAPFKLSGIIYYLRSYIFFLIVSIYILQRRRPSTTLIILYSLIAGFTAASRFVAVLPIILLLARYFLENHGRFDKKVVALLVSIILMYSLITLIRAPFYEEGFKLASYFDLLNNYWSSVGDFMDEGALQLFLRSGLGRDVILAYEVMENESCQSLSGLLFKYGSCVNPPFDFYGLELYNNKFYLANPQFSSLITLSLNPMIAFIYSLVYASIVCVILFLTSLIRRTKAGLIFYMPLYLLLNIFIVIGPILYAWYLTVFVILMNLFYILIKATLRKRQINIS
jgi:hypothetical protein